MNCVLVILGAVSLFWIVKGIELNGFRVKFNVHGALRDTDSFFNIPRTTKDAARNGFVEIPRSGDGFDVTMRCLKNDVRVCPLYDKAGYIAGLQVAIPVKDLVNLPYDISEVMTKQMILNNNYWTSTHYVVSPETIRKGGRKGPLKETIEEIWIQNGRQLINIPRDEDDIASKTLFKRQNCLSNMGGHYFYNMTEELNCKTDLLLPYFILVKNKRLHGIGWQIIGRTRDQGRPWFEAVPPIAIDIILPRSPVCLRDWLRRYGVTSLHIYYVEEPWKITCEDKDSVQPVPVFNKFVVDISGFFSNAVDQISGLFGLLSR